MFYNAPTNSIYILKKKISNLNVNFRIKFDNIQFNFFYWPLYLNKNIKFMSNERLTLCYLICEI